MRLAYLVSLYPAVSHSFIRREVEALRGRGAEVHTFSLRRPEPTLVVSEADRAELSRTTCLLPTDAAAVLPAVARATGRPIALAGLLRDAWHHRMPGLRTAGIAPFRAAEAPLLARELERREIRHLHCHFANTGGDVAWLASRFLGIGLRFTLHGTADFDESTPAPLGEKIAAARFVACVSHFGRAQACQASDPVHWEKILVSRCGLDVESVAEEAARATPHSRPTLISVGRLSPEKDQLGLLQAFARMLETGADFELRRVGEGPHRRRLEAAIPERVEDGVSGALFRSADGKQLAATILALLSDAPRRRRLAEGGRRRVGEAFSMKHAVEPLWRRLEDVAA